MIIFRETGIKLFARISRISKSWKLPVSLPEGAIPHPNRMYSRYMAVWENPDNLGSAINRFRVIKGTYFRLDMKDRDDYISRNIESSINLTRNLDLAVEDIYIITLYSTIMIQDGETKNMILIQELIC